MYNVSVEQILKVNQPAIAKLYKGIMIVLCVVCTFLIPQTYAIGVLLLAIMVVLTVVLFKYYKAEYEYSLVETELTVDKIMDRSIRKRCGSYNIGKAELIAPVKSQEALRLEHRKLKAIDYSSGVLNENTYVAYAFNNNNEMVKLTLELDDRMKEAIKSVIPKKFY